MTVALIGTCVYATSQQDIGTYTNYSFNIGAQVIFPAYRVLLWPYSQAVNNNSNMSNSYFYTSFYNYLGTICITDSKKLTSGARVNWYKIILLFSFQEKIQNFNIS